MALPSPAEWQQVSPGGETRCAHNTPYAFWTRSGPSERLVLYFQGGGGCWDAATCAQGSTFYDDVVSVNDSPEFRAGIFEFANPDNPFAEDDFVYIPSCTGDVHWGDRVQSYPEADGGELTIFHRGFVNAQAALSWASETFRAPESVFITGCSAGSVGSAAHAPYVIEQYPGTPVHQLGDSLAFVFHRPLNLSEYGTYGNLAPWVTGFRELAPGTFTMARYYLALAAHYPDYTFAQFNFEADRVQDRYYLAVGGQPGDFPEALAASLAEIQAGAPNFRSYQAEGELHCILPTSRFYEQERAGVPFRDWVQDLVAGKGVPDIP